uniref:Uncharacterized protein n=1 Tax=mine drainage metagenome TaxID=410659 RepID=E6QIX2_9ZZZZ
MGAILGAVFSIMRLTGLIARNGYEKSVGRGIASSLTPEMVGSFRQGRRGCWRGCVPAISCREDDMDSG